eukprot:2480717-Prymnesium_polylepis.2
MGQMGRPSHQATADQTRRSSPSRRWRRKRATRRRRPRADSSASRDAQQQTKSAQRTIQCLVPRASAQHAGRFTDHKYVTPLALSTA